MKQGIHPVYQEVIYRDISSGYAFLTRSTAQPKETEVWEDGKEYPVIKIEISSASHPFFTGKHRLMDTAGRIEKFNQRYASNKKPSKKGESST
jgi:large subunit ribosomal protein L31